jgi:hypothetical protein
MTSVEAQGRNRIELHNAARAGAALLVAILAVVGWGWISGREGRAFERLPAEERRALLDRTLTNLRNVCSGPDEVQLQRFCEEQALVALRLPECDAECKVVAERHVPRATK